MNRAMELLKIGAKSSLEKSVKLGDIKTKKVKMQSPTYVNKVKYDTQVKGEFQGTEKKMNDEIKGSIWGKPKSAVHVEQPKDGAWRKHERATKKLEEEAAQKMKDLEARETKVTSSPGKPKMSTGKKAMIAAGGIGAGLIAGGIYQSRQPIEKKGE